MKLIPSARLVIAAALWAAAGIVVAFFPSLTVAWLAIGALLLAVALADALLLSRSPRPFAERVVAHSMPIGQWREVAVRVHNTGRYRVTYELFDHFPSALSAEGLPRALSADGNAWTQVKYRVRARERGNHQFAAVQLRQRSSSGLWQLSIMTGEPSTIRVYPNFAALSKYALFATDNRLSDIGVLRKQRRGEGMDFDQLREYQEGDSLRKIDWKASQRVQKLISREYQDERDQQVMFMVDCSRRMRAHDDDYSHFDHALDAVLLLAYVSLRQGDAVGLMTMSGEQRFLAPRKSARTVNRLLNAVYDLQPGLQTVDYYNAALAVSKRLRKRALIVIVSNLRDEDDDSLLPALALLRRRHLVLFANLKERALDDALTAPVVSLDSALVQLAAADYSQRRKSTFDRIKSTRALTLDVPPEALPTALVNRYLEAKAGGVL